MLPKRLPMAFAVMTLSAPLFSLPAVAQSETAAGDNPATQKATASTSLEEVVVTARRRSESLQETPIAVTAMSGTEIRERGIVSVTELTKSVPSVEITESVSNLIYIRGVGQRAAFARVDSTVGVYLDNIFLPRADGQLMDTVDVENIQVLRGPQGTLFGKNTTGGAMVLTLEKPSDTREGYISATAGNYGRQQIRAAVNLPLTDNLYSRFAFNSLRDDGFFKDISQNKTNTSKDRQSFMAQLRWDASASLTMDSLLYAGKIDERLPGSNCVLINEENALFQRGLYILWQGDTTPGNPTAYKENCNSNSRERLGDLKSNMGPNNLMDRTLDTYLLATTINWTLSDTLATKVILGARDETKGPLISSDQDGGPQNFTESFTTGDGERRSYSAEFQLNGSLFEGAVNYTGGLFAMQETNTEEFTLINALNGLDATTLASIAAGQQPTQPPLNGTSPVVGVLVDPIQESDFDLENITLAAFFQSSWDITQQLELTLGIRWTEETRRSDLSVLTSDKDAIGQTIFLSGQGFGPAAEGFNPYAGPWSDDPIQLAMNLFPDADGDGFNDFPMNTVPSRVDHKKRIFRKVTPMLSLSYQLPDHWLDDSVVDTAMLYGTWSNGFKSGFFEPKGVDGLQQVEPEEVENRELGFKVEAFNRSLRFNVAVYNMDFDNQQLIQVDADSNNSLVVIYDNAGRSKITGGEMELQWMPSPGLLLNASASHNEYEFTEFTDNDLLQAVLGNQVTVDRSDETFPVAPETTFAFGIQYSYSSDIGIFTPRLDYSYKSDVYYGLDNGAWDVYQDNKDNAGQTAYDIVDLRFTWQSNEGDLSIAGYVKNATDKRYDIGIAAVADSTATFFQTYGDPRRYGLEIRKQF